MTTLAIELEEPTKEALAACAASQHISLEEFARNILIKQAGCYNAETMQAIDDVNNGRNLSRTFNTIEELMEELNA